MATVRVFHTHIEVYPYELGDCPALEKMLSKYDRVTHARISIGFYIQNDILYLPRGINTSLLEQWFHCLPTPVLKPDDYCKISKGAPLYKPKTEIQSNAIDFLTSQNNFVYTGRYSQFGLNLDQGDGKTYAAIVAILKLKLRAIIITHQETLKEQWMHTLETMTTFPMEKFCNIEGSEVMEEIMKGKITAEIFCVNQQTLNAYARVHGWSSIRDFFKKIKVGIKVVDETHKFFENTLMIDYFSNVFKSFYLTATFGRSDPMEVSIYKKAYSHLVRYGEETINSEEKRKHINFIIVYFWSKPEYGVKPNVRNRYGFSNYKYIDYELHEHNDSLRKVLFHILDQTRHIEGKTLVLSPKTESVDILATDMERYLNRDSSLFLDDDHNDPYISVGTVHSKNSEKQNKENFEKNIISSTVKSVGEGVDIKGLRILINLDPISSKVLADQVRGRLREYSKEDDTYLFYPVDMSVSECYESLKRILPIMKKKCKEIYTIKMDV